MKVRKAVFSLMAVLVLSLAAALFLFVFNPLGLGPEPETVLAPEFFANPDGELNDLQLLADGKTAFDRIFAAIDTARTCVRVQTYIWKDDDTGKAVAAKLKAAADRGVQVVVSKDMLGTFFELGDMLRGQPSPALTRSGLKGHEKIRVITDLFADTDHSKYYIIDRRSAIFGGMNIADEYRFLWNDAMALLRGGAWVEAFADKVLKGTPWPYPSPIVLAVNDSRKTEIRRAILQILEHAGRRIVIEHAYFSDDKVIEAVIRAAARGVRVEVILPKVPDTHLYANMATVNRLLDPASGRVPKVFLYPHMSHAKVIMTDGAIAAVGSANLTPRSMLTSKEVTLFAHGAPDALFIRELREKLEGDMALSEEVVKPFALGPLEQVMAFVGKYVW